MKPKVVCIVQARTGSSRLPGKVLKDLAGHPMLTHIINRLKTCRTIDGLVIATTTHNRDLPIVELANLIGIDCFRGDENDVLGRYIGAAEVSGAEVVVRVTGDCPLIDPVTVDSLVNHFLSNNFDYAVAGVSSGFPRGLDTELCTFTALLRAHKDSMDEPSREHVTYYLYQHPEIFKIGYLPAPSELRHPDWRLCVDEKDDFHLISTIYNRLYKPGEIIDFSRVVDLLINEPELLNINTHVKQKSV